MVISFHLSNIFSLSLSFLPHFFFSFLLFSLPAPIFHQLPDCMSDTFGVRQAEGRSLPSLAVFIPLFLLRHLAERLCLQVGS